MFLVIFGLKVFDSKQNWIFCEVFFNWLILEKKSFFVLCVSFFPAFFQILLWEQFQILGQIFTEIFFGNLSSFKIFLAIKFHIFKVRTKGTLHNHSFDIDWTPPQNFGMLWTLPPPSGSARSGQKWPTQRWRQNSLNPLILGHFVPRVLRRGGGDCSSKVSDLFYLKVESEPPGVVQQYGRLFHSIIQLTLSVKDLNFFKVLCSRSAALPGGLTFFLV